MHEASALFGPMVAALHVEDAQERKLCVQGVAAALGGGRLPVMPRLCPRLATILRTMPQRTRPRAAPPTPDRSVPSPLTGFFPSSGYVPVEGEQMDVVIRQADGWAEVTAEVLGVLPTRQSGATGYRIWLREVSDELLERPSRP